MSDDKASDTAEDICEKSNVAEKICENSEIAEEICENSEVVEEIGETSAGILNYDSDEPRLELVRLPSDIVIPERAPVANHQREVEGVLTERAMSPTHTTFWTLFREEEKEHYKSLTEKYVEPYFTLRRKQRRKKYRLLCSNLRKMKNVKSITNERKIKNSQIKKIKLKVEILKLQKLDLHEQIIKNCYNF